MINYSHSFYKICRDKKEHDRLNKIIVYYNNNKN